MSKTVLQTPKDLIHLQLRTALTMEDDSLSALEELEAAATSDEVKKLFHHHQEETRGQIANLHRVFDILEIPMSSEPSPSTKGISEQARSLIERADASLLDQVTLSAALGNEHYEIAAYTSLVAAVGGQYSDAGQLLHENLDQEAHTSRELADQLRSLTT